MQGLWDMHVHTLWNASVVAPSFNSFLQAGVTSVRDMGGDLAVAQAPRADLATCRLSRPHTWYPGPFLDGPEPADPALSIALSTPDEGRVAVRRFKAEGVDFLKVYRLMRLDILKAVTEEAAVKHLDVVGHFPANGNIADAARAGLSDIEHLAIEIGGYCLFDARERCESIFDELVKARVAQTPKLIARETSTRLGREEFAEASEIADLPPAVQKYWRGERASTKAKATPEWLASRETSLKHARWMTRQLSIKGVVILAGFDAGTAYVLPGSSLHDELGLLVQAGLTNAEALRAATLTPARVMKRPDMGVIKTGYVADLVLLRDNPLSEVNNVRLVNAVFIDGRQVFASAPGS